MSEHVARSFSQESAGESPAWLLEESMGRRRFLKEKIAASLAVTVLSGSALHQVALPKAIKRFNRYRSIGGDYSNWPFFNEVDAHPIDRERLAELLGDEPRDKEVILTQTTHESWDDPKKIAEYDMIAPHDGPTYAEFGGLYGADLSLTILRAVVDDEDELLIPLIRDDVDQPPLSIQLGNLTEGGHKLELFVEHNTEPVTAEEITPRVTQGTSGTLRDILYRHQPDVYLNDYDTIANNFPRRSYVEVLETGSGDIAVVYTIESFDEDEVLGLIGTSVQQLVHTKSRPSDYDWALELLIKKDEGVLLVANICEPYHNRQPVSIDPDRATERLALRADSPNNNWEFVDTDSPLREQAKFRPVPRIAIHDEMYGIRRSTDISTARWSLCENYGERRINPDNPADAVILEQFYLDADRCKL